MPPTPNAARKNAALGLMLAGTGRPEGFALFDATISGFLASLAPLLGIMIALTGVIVWYGSAWLAATFFLTALCDLLAPVIIADLFCRRWKLGDRWALYANVLNFSQWLLLAVLLLLLLGASMAVAAGLPVRPAAGLVGLGLTLYLLWFHWFTARHVLGISSKRALLVMVTVVFGTMLLLQLPAYAGALAGISPPAGLSSFDDDAPDAKTSTP